MRRGFALAFAALLYGGSTGCTKRAPPANEPIAAELSGCVTIASDGACVVEDDRKVRIWAPSQWRNGLHAEVDGQGIAPDGTFDLPDGIRLHFTLPAGARTLRLIGHSGEYAGEQTFAFRARREPAAIASARIASKNGESDSITRTLVPVLSSFETVDRAAAEGLVARAALRAGHLREAADHFKSALLLDSEAGLTVERTRDALALVFIYVHRQYRFQEARALLDEVQPIANTFADGRAFFPYSAGFLALEIGDLRGALASFRKAQLEASRLGLTQSDRGASDRIAATLQLLGRTDEASAILESLQVDPVPADLGCEVVDARNNLGWLRLNDSRVPSDVAAKTARPHFESALTLFPSSCIDGYRKANVLTNLAMAAARSSAPKEARLRMQDARRATDDHESALTAWWMETDGEIALAEGNPAGAAIAFEEAVHAAGRLDAPDVHWRALVGRGDALDRLGDPRARASYEEAEALLDRASGYAPIGEGRGAFLRAHDTSGARLVDLLVRKKRFGDALAAIESSRARLLDGVTSAVRLAHLGEDSRRQYEIRLGELRRARDVLTAEAKEEAALPSDERTRAQRSRRARESELRASLESTLAAIVTSSSKSGASVAMAPDALTLAFHSSAMGLTVIAREPNGHLSAANMRALPVHAPNEIVAQAMLEPFHAEIARAKRIDIRAYGDMAGIDVHALPFEGAPLIERAIVSYPVGKSANGAEGSSKHALVIGDPLFDLPAANVEARNVARELAGRGWETAALVGRAATRASALEAMATASLFHYSGHALHAGLDGWESRLALAGSDELTLGDVLSLPHVPSVVVLDGCEAGRVADANGNEALGLARAFIVMGSQVAIAPTRTVDDTLAAEFGRALYATSHVDDDWPAALRRAVLTLRAAHPEWAHPEVARPDSAHVELDWSAYRAFVQ